MSVKTVFSIAAGPDFTPMQAIRPEAVDLLTASAVADATAAFTADELLAVYASVVVHVAIGAEAEAAATDLPIPAGTPMFFAAKSGDILSVLKMDGQADGLVWVAKASV